MERLNLKELLASTKPDMAKLPGGFEPDYLPKIISGTGRKKMSFSDNCFVLADVLSSHSCHDLINVMAGANSLQPVTINGMMDVTDATVGSRRATAWSPDLAVAIWDKMSTYFGEREFGPYTPTDWWQGDRNRTKWEPVGLSPLLRFMRYEDGGQHYAHYDAGFIYPDDNYRTLMSIVIYLTSTETGLTRIIKDVQQGLPVWERDHSDWTREATNEEVIFASRPKEGNIFVFDHRICHDVSKFDGPTEKFNNPRIIIRGDVLYKAV